MANNKLDWSFKAFLEACAEVDLSSTAKSIQRQKQAKKTTKHIKKQNKRKNRQTATLITAHHFNKEFNQFVFGNDKRR